MHAFPNAQHVRFRTAPDPQLAVCKGLVTDHLRKLKSGSGVLDWRCCRASYGTLCKVLYDRKNPGIVESTHDRKGPPLTENTDHQGKRTHKDPINGKVYISNAIAWFIKKVCQVPLDAVTATHDSRENRYG